jgi:hypothetical protein
LIARMSIVFNNQKNPFVFIEEMSFFNKVSLSFT